MLQWERNLQEDEQFKLYGRSERYTKGDECFHSSTTESHFFELSCSEVLIMKYLRMRLLAFTGVTSLEPC